MAVGGFSETSNEGVGFGLGFASTMDAAACGTVGEGDFYWGGLASTLFWVDPVEDLYVIFMTQLILLFLQLSRANQEYCVWRSHGRHRPLNALRLVMAQSESCCECLEMRQRRVGQRSQVVNPFER